jgi:hypothetical protein
MRILWKGLSKVGDNGDVLLFIKVRREEEMVVSKNQIIKFLSDLAGMEDRKHISRGTRSAWIVEFDQITSVLSQLSDAPKGVKHTSLETP